MILAVASTVSWAGKPPPANKPPTVSLTSPTNGATFSAPATINLAATAADADGTVQRVEFYNGTQLLGTRTASPYSMTWSNVGAGTYTFTAKAFDNSYAMTTSAAVTVTVTGTTNTVITSPAYGATVRGSFNVTGSFYGDANTRVWVDYDNGTRLAKTNGNAFTATGIALSPGPHTIDVTVARTNKTSEKTSFTVNKLDNPVIALTSPSTSVFTAPASIPLAVDAVSPGGSISKVTFFESGALLASVTGPPYEYVWNGVPKGEYTITAEATDHLGYSASLATSISVLGPNVPPSVAITSPANGTSFPAPADITLSADAADSDGTVSTVFFYQNGNLVAATNSPPYSANWPNVAAGSYTLTATATDNSDATTTSAPVTITIAPPSNPPAVSLTAPTTGASYSVPATINLAATASDSDGTVAKVEFYQGGILLATVTTPPYAYSWSGMAAGSYSLTAKATDNAEVSAVSAPVTVTVATVPGQTITYLHSDLLGSPIAATDENGILLWRENYRPYGARLVNAAAATGNRQWYTGKPVDQETGLSYFGARYYDPAVGRFMGIDAAEYSDSNLHSFNRYAYANNNPYRFVDPDGRESVEAWFGSKAPIVVAGKAFGGLAAYAVGAVTGDTALQDAAIDGMRENRQLNIETAIILGTVRGGPSKERMLGESGTQVASKTLWKGNGKERLDVENPNPGQRPGQLHYQDNEGNKYLYDPKTNTFPDASNSVNKLMENSKFKDAIEKGMTKYLGE